MIVCWSSDAFGYSEAADLNCVGRIVRVESEIASPAQCKLAATIDFYTFMRQSSGT